MYSLLPILFVEILHLLRRFLNIDASIFDASIFVLKELMFFYAVPVK